MLPGRCPFHSGATCHHRRRRPSLAARPGAHPSPVQDASHLHSFTGRGTCISCSSAPSALDSAAQRGRWGNLKIQQHEPALLSAAEDGQDAEAAGTAGIPPAEEWGSVRWLMSGCEPQAAPLRVAVLVSGGVDSSLAMHLVKCAGHEVRAFYLQIWFQEDFRNFWDECPWEEDLRYAREVCGALGIDLEVVPMTQEYWERVVSESVGEIKAGRTPNPDILCNSRVKFGAFFEYLDRTHPGQFDRIASGHYAALQRPPSGVLEPNINTHTELPVSGCAGTAPAARLVLTPDAVKDQTYFLAQLSLEQLARAMFPLGALTKPQVRALAQRAGLATSARKDSQGICFLGQVKFGEFVREHLGEWAGPLLEAETGAPLGLHRGYWFYTVGQRGGIKLPGGPWYVVHKDLTLNIVYVSKAYYTPDKPRNTFTCGPFNWLGPDRPTCQHGGRGTCAEAGTAAAPGSDHEVAPLMVKVRHGPSMYRCRLDMVSRGELEEAAPFCTGVATSVAGPPGEYARVTLEANDQGLAPGQYAVFYQGGVCLGAAKILESGSSVAVNW